MVYSVFQSGAFIMHNNEYHFNDDDFITVDWIFLGTKMPIESTWGINLKNLSAFSSGKSASITKKSF